MHTFILYSLFILVFFKINIWVTVTIVFKQILYSMLELREPKTFLMFKIYAIPLMNVGFFWLIEVPSWKSTAIV